MVFYVWFHATIICLPIIFVNKLQETDYGLYCREEWSTLTEARVYLICYTLFTIICPLIVTCMAYCFVWRAFRNSQMKVNIMSAIRRAKQTSYLPYASKTEIRLLKMLFLMVFCFVTLWAPYVVHRFLIYMRHETPQSDYLILTAMWICKVQPVLDPLIYGYLNKQYKRSLFDICRICSIQCTCPADLAGDDWSSLDGAALHSSESDGSRACIVIHSTPVNATRLDHPIPSMTIQATPATKAQDVTQTHDKEFLQHTNIQSTVDQSHSLNKSIKQPLHQIKSQPNKTVTHTFYQTEVYTISPLHIQNNVTTPPFELFATGDPETIMEWKSINRSHSRNPQKLLNRRMPYLHARMSVKPEKKKVPGSTSDCYSSQLDYPSSESIPCNMLYRTAGCYRRRSTTEEATGNSDRLDEENFCTPFNVINQSAFQRDTLMMDGMNQKNRREFLPPISIENTTKKKRRKRRKLLHKRIAEQEPNKTG